MERTPTRWWPKIHTMELTELRAVLCNPDLYSVGTIRTHCNLPHDGNLTPSIAVVGVFVCFPSSLLN